MEGGWWRVKGGGLSHRRWTMRGINRSQHREVVAHLVHVEGSEFRGEGLGFRVLGSEFMV